MYARIDIPGLDRSVARIGLGCMLLSTEGRPSRAEALRTIHAALDGGVSLLDTADVYALDEADVGHNERLLAEAVRGYGSASDRPLIATKGGMVRRGTAWHADGRPEWIRRACESSLTNLGTDSVDLYQLHTPDPEVPYADSVGEVARLREEGKVLAMGVSNVSPAQLVQALEIGPVVSVQNGYGPWCASRYKPRVIDLCEKHGLVFLAHSPFGGRGGAGAFAEEPSLREAVVAGATPHETALAWLMSQSSAIVPIPGVRRVSTVESSLSAASLQLDEDDVRRLTRVYLRTFVETNPVRRLAGTFRSVIASFR